MRSSDLAFVTKVVRTATLINGLAGTTHPEEMSFSSQSLTCDRAMLGMESKAHVTAGSVPVSGNAVSCAFRQGFVWVNVAYGVISKICKAQVQRPNASSWPSHVSDTAIWTKIVGRTDMLQPPCHLRM